VCRPAISVSTSESEVGELANESESELTPVFCRGTPKYSIVTNICCGSAKIILVSLALAGATHENKGHTLSYAESIIFTINDGLFVCTSHQ